MTPVWRKSSHSGTGANSDCVEVAALADGIGLRDSKRPEGGHLALSRETFARLVVQIKRA
jgi:hypothetical protein